MKSLIILICVLCLPVAEAKELGVFGKTYPILEMDFLEYVQKKIESMQASGEWQSLQADFKKRVTAHLLRPTPNHLPRASDNRSWFFNPSITVPYDVRDTEGHVIVGKGTVINPLEKTSLSSTLLLFDGDDKEQVEWATEELKQHERIKLILVSGSIKKATGHFKQAVYFDLNGVLVSRFHIVALPARVFQAGMRLEINEVPI